MNSPVIAVAEGRELEKLATLLENGGATVIRCPMLAMAFPENGAPVTAFIHQAIAGEFDEVLFMTGEGVTRLFAHAEREGTAQALTESLRRIRVVARGFKAVNALKSLGIPLAGIAEPPTSEGVLSVWRENPPTGRRVGLIRAGDEIPVTLEKHLAGLPASVTAVSSYVYAPASDSAAIADLLERLARKEVSVLALTSIAQARALLNAAERQGRPLPALLANTAVASIGPALTAFLAEQGIRVGLQPESRHFLAPFAKTILEATKTRPTQ